MSENTNSDFEVVDIPIRPPRQRMGVYFRAVAQAVTLPDGKAIRLPDGNAAPESVAAALYNAAKVQGVRISVRIIDGVVFVGSRAEGGQ